MPLRLGPTELILILVIVVIFFGVGRLPEVFGSVGKGIREFRKAAEDDMDDEDLEEEEEEKPAKKKKKSTSESEDVE
jgi:sec-independent protein translocase protein TatA